MKICFWGNIAGALKGVTDGGAELQIALLAKVLARAGHEITIIDFQTDEEFITDEGIKVLRIKGWNNGIRFLRTFTHRLPQIYLSLKGQRADVYYCRIRDYRHILAYWAARKVKAKFILGIASDLDAMTFSMRLKYNKIAYFSGLWGFLNGILIEIVYPWLLRNADLVLVQHNGQKSILQKQGINSRVFPNLIDLSEFPVASNKAKTDFIYVGWLSKRKGFPEFYEVIRKCPTQTFKVIGPPCDKVGHAFYKELQSFNNVTLYGKLSHSEVLKNMMNSKALISTSQMEGFPNIFIEAWACGIPVLSLYVDPGDVISNEGLGKFADGNSEELIQSIKEFNNSPNFSNKARGYVELTHSLSKMKIEEIDVLFKELMKK